MDKIRLLIRLRMEVLMGSYQFLLKMDTILLLGKMKVELQYTQEVLLSLIQKNYMQFLTLAKQQALDV